jgi:hypothetical protein
LAQELTRFYEALWLDVPHEAAKMLVDAGNEKQLRKAGWRAYDAWVSVANELVNMFYADPVVGEISGQFIEAALRWRQISEAAGAVFFGNLWPSIGLPTHGEIVALRDELRALREELAAYADLPAPRPAAEPGVPHVERIWQGNQVNRNHTHNGAGFETAFPQGKRHAAAK